MNSCLHLKRSQYSDEQDVGNSWRLPRSPQHRCATRDKIDPSLNIYNKNDFIKSNTLTFLFPFVGFDFFPTSLDILCVNCELCAPQSLYKFRCDATPTVCVCLSVCVWVGGGGEPTNVTALTMMTILYSTLIIGAEI